MVITEICASRQGVHNIRPAGRMRPAETQDAARLACCRIRKITPYSTDIFWHFTQLNRRTQISNSYHKCTETFFDFWQQLHLWASVVCHECKQVEAQITFNRWQFACRYACCLLPLVFEHWTTGFRQKMQYFLLSECTALWPALLRWRTWEARIILVY